MLEHAFVVPPVKNTLEFFVRRYSPSDVKSYIFEHFVVEMLIQEEDAVEVKDEALELFHCLRVRSFPPRAHAAAFEIIGEFGEGNRVLGIRGDLAHEDGAFHRFFVSHDEDVWHGERAGRRHLFGDAFVPEALVYGNGSAAEIFKHSEDAMARFAAEVCEIDGRLRFALRRSVFALYTRLSAYLTGDGYHRRGRRRARETARERVIAAAECKGHAGARLRIIGRYLEERVRPAIAAA